MKHAFALVTLAVTTMLATNASAQSVVSPEPVGSPREQLDTIVERLQARAGYDLALYAELNKQLLDTPSLMADIPDIVRSRKVSLDTSDTLIFSVEDVGTPTAQSLLVSIAVDDRQRHMDRLRAVMGLGAQESPTAATTQSLWAVAERRFEPHDTDISNTALLSLGVIGNTLKHTSSPSYPRLREGLLAHLQGTTNPFERAMTLKAIGNLHDPSLGGQVAAYLYDESVSVRASAALSIGMLRDVSQRDVLAGLIEGEPRGAVRTALAEALRRLPADRHSLQAVLARVRFDPHPEARAQMVSYLVEHLADFEEARATLREMTFTDPTKQVRMLASASLR